MAVRRLRADEWERWRAFRLAMLADAPYAFGTTLAEASAYTEETWRERTALMATSEDTVLYVADDGADWQASAGGYVEDGVANVFSVWTRPDARGNGHAEAAVTAVVEWARGRGETEIRLWVTDTNDTARRLYERLGFAGNGTVQPLPSDPRLTESEYALPLRD
jgi:ribosomal protein S18 acetylase RimI-like enzyme